MDYEMKFQHEDWVNPLCKHDKDGNTYDRVYVFHHYDADGYASAAILGAIFKITGVPTEFISVEHSTPMDLRDVADCIHAGLNVFVGIVDYSFSRPDDQENLIEVLKLKAGTFVWIDHHNTSKKIEGNPWFGKLEGLRVLDEGSPKAGCYLTYEWAMLRGLTDKEMEMFPHLTREDYIPTWVKMISDYDTWQPKDEPRYMVKAINFYGLKQVFLDNTDSDVEKTFLDIMVDHESGRDMSGEIPCIPHYINFGETLTKIDNTRNARRVKNNSFTSKVYVNINPKYIDPNEDIKELPVGKDGMIKFSSDIIVMSGGGNSLVFGDKVNEYDAVSLFSTNDGLKYVYSMYSAEDKAYCNVFALFFGKFFGITGGGHRHAAGWTSPMVIFKKDHKYYITADNQPKGILEHVNSFVKKVVQTYQKEVRGQEVEDIFEVHVYEQKPGEKNWNELKF